MILKWRNHLERESLSPIAPHPLSADERKAMIALEKASEDYWDRWKGTRLEGASRCIVSGTSTLTTNQRQSLANNERRNTIRATRTTRGRAKLDQLQDQLQKPYHDMKTTTDRRSEGIRKRKHEDQRQSEEVVQRSRRLRTLNNSATQESPSGCVTPTSSDGLRPRQAIAKRQHKPSRQERNHNRNLEGMQSKLQAQPRYPYLTPDSLNYSNPRAGQRRKHKGFVRQKRQLDRDSTYRGSRAVSQPIEPVSSRLRSKGCREGRISRTTPRTGRSLCIQQA